MKEWLYWLVGFDASGLPTGAQVELAWSHPLTSWRAVLGVLVVIGLVYGVARLYRRENDRCPVWARWVLAGTRSAVLIVLALIFLGPALVVTRVRVIHPTILVLLDNSMSMSVRDRYREEKAAVHAAGAMGCEATQLRSMSPSRAQVVNHVLGRGGGGFLRELSRKGNVRVVAFSSRAASLAEIPSEQSNAEKGSGLDGSGGAANDPAAKGIGPGGLDRLLTPSGQGTNLAGGMRESLKGVSSGPIAALVVFSDGQNTEGDDPAAAAEWCGTRRAPVLTVGVGDPSASRNIRVTELWASQTVWRDDPFQIEAVVQSNGIKESAVQVELIEEQVDDAAAGFAASTEDSGKRTLQVKTISLAGDRTRENVVFTHKPSRAGRFSYSVRAAPVPEEDMDTDNAMAADVTVMDSRARVLLVAGEASWEYQLVRQLLMRDRTISVSCWLQSNDPGMPQDGSKVIDRFPGLEEDLFRYDLVVLLDPDPFPTRRSREFTPSWMEMLKRFVGEHAGGLLYMAGPKYSARYLSDPETRSIRDLLPVGISDGQSLDVESLIKSFGRAWPLRLTAEGSDHPILSLSDDPRINRSRWEALPGIYWSLPVEAAKPGSVVLMEHSDADLRAGDGARPLLVSGIYGGGRTIFLGFDGSWRWRSVGHDSEYFDRFWIGAVRYLIEGRRIGGQRRGMLASDRGVYTINETVHLTARLYDQQFKPLVGPAVQGVFRAGKGAATTVELKAVGDRPGRYEAFIPAGEVGPCELSIVLGDQQAGRVDQVRAQWVVELPKAEFKEVRLDKGVLQAIADRSGGRYFEVDQMEELLSSVPDRRETIVTRGRPVMLWDTPAMLALLTTMLIVEWGVRKHFALA